jgi:hypothetical protein
MRPMSILAAGAFVLAAPLSAQTPGDPQPVAASSGPGIEFSTGLEYEEGKYGTGQKVETVSIPAGLRVSTGKVQLSATLPYVRVDAPGNVIGGGGLLGLPIVVDPTQPATRTRREGVGDLRLGAAYTVPSSSIGLTIASEVKVPTASQAKGLGTGEVDYAIAAELSKTVGRVTPFVGIGYSLPGDPEGYELRDSLSARAGAAVQMSPNVRGHVAYGYARSLSPLVPDEQQIATGLNANVSQRLSLGLYGSAGLSDGAPDVGAGVRLGFRIR